MRFRYAKLEFMLQYEDLIYVRLTQLSERETANAHILSRLFLDINVEK